MSDLSSVFAYDTLKDGWKQASDSVAKIVVSKTFFRSDGIHPKRADIVFFFFNSHSFHSFEIKELRKHASNKVFTS